MDQLTVAICFEKKAVKNCCILIKEDAASINQRFHLVAIAGVAH
jgi:hypothetical protein